LPIGKKILKKWLKGMGGCDGPCGLQAGTKTFCRPMPKAILAPEKVGREKIEVFWACSQKKTRFFEAFLPPKFFKLGFRWC